MTFSGCWGGFRSFVSSRRNQKAGGQNYRSLGGVEDRDGFSEDGKQGTVCVKTVAAFDLPGTTGRQAFCQGLYCKAKLGARKKAKTSCVPLTPDPAWNESLSLPWNGEVRLRLVVMKRFRFRRNKVVGECGLALTCIPPGGLSTDLQLCAPGQDSKKVGLLSISLEVPSKCGSGCLDDPMEVPPYSWDGSGIEPEPEATSTGRPDFSRGRQEQHIGAEDNRARQRERSLEAAEKRQRDSQNRGIGDPNRARQLNERAQREELLGRIHARCQMLGEEPPMGLQMASMQQLQAVWQRLGGDMRD